MTAQEMFEELGYTSLTKNYTEGKLKTIEYENEECVRKNGIGVAR